MLLTQTRLLDLAHGVARQLVDKKHALGNLEARQALFATCDDRGLVWAVFPPRRSDGRGHRLPQIAMRQADHGRFEDARYLLDDGLDPARIDIEAAGDHDVLGAADQAQVAVIAQEP